MYKLYHFPFSQHGRRVVSLLEQANLAYQVLPINMMAGEHRSEAYLALNPNHQVPVLVDEDFSLYESNAILRYLCEKHDLKQWYPSDIRLRAQVNLWLDWNQTLMGQSTVDIVLNSVFLGDKGDQDAIARGKLQLQALIQVLENHLSQTNYLVGDTPTIADLSLASNIFQLSLAKIFPETASLSRWYKSVSELEGFRKSLPEK